MNVEIIDVLKIIEFYSIYRLFDNLYIECEVNFTHYRLLA